MKITGNIILIILISIVVSSAVFFAIHAFDLDRQNLEIQVAALQEKIIKLENMVKTLSNDSDDVRNNKMKGFLEESEKNLKLNNKTDFNKLEARLDALEASKNKNSEKDDRTSDKPDNEGLSEEKVDPIYNLFREYSKDNHNPENGIEIILRTDGKLSDSQCKQIIKLYTNKLVVEETAIPIIGDEGKFNIWKKNGKVVIIFTRQHENRKFEDYYKHGLTIAY